MPLFNVIRGERIETAPWHVHPPVLRIPWWVSLVWSLGKLLVTAVVLMVRWWPVTAPTIFLLWWYARYDWTGVAILAAILATIAGIWCYLDIRSFRR